MGALPFQTTFPFLTFEGEAPLWAALGASLAVTLLYAVTAGLVFEMTRGTSAPAPVKFIARNTLIIFLGHMPLFYAINPLLAAAGLDYWSIVAVRLAACLGGVGLLSEAIIRVVRPHELREAFAAALSNSSTFARLGWYSRRRT
jgi:hypothetical protein